MATIFVMLAVFGRDRKFDDGIILSCTVGLMLYEIGQPLMGNPIDPWDVGATAVAGVLSWVLYRSIHGAGRYDSDKKALQSLSSK